MIRLKPFAVLTFCFCHIFAFTSAQFRVLDKENQQPLAGVYLLVENGEKRRRNRRSRLGKEREDVNPLHAVANLFDVSIVFAVALMVALVSRFNMTEVFSKEDYTVVKNPGKADMEIITKKGETISKYKAGQEKAQDSKNKGKRIGTAYQLEDGEIIYIPDTP